MTDPLLGVVYSSRSRPWLEIVEAGTGLCRFLWIVKDPRVGNKVGILKKFGKVIDAIDCTPEELIRLVHAERPDGITSYFDTDLHLQAFLAAALGLPSPSVREVVRLTDKLLQREALDSAGVPIPKYAEIREPVDMEQITRLCEALSFPMILKPRNGTACQEVQSVEDAETLIRLLGATVHPSRMILEERMPDLHTTTRPYAERVSIDSVVSQGVFSHLGITGLFPMAPPFRSSGGFFPADVPAGEIPGLFGLATSAIKALGAEFGCYRTEIKLCPDGQKIIEVNGRPTGLTPAAVKLASGLPLLQLSMELALGSHVVIDGPVHCDKVAYRYYCEAPMTAETVQDISGLDRLGKLEGVEHIDVHKGIGDQVDWRNGSLDKVFQVTGAVANHAELAEHYRWCTEEVRVTYQHRA